MNLEQPVWFLWLQALLVLGPSGCLGQEDCSGPCPALQNCIEEVLERGACCPSCVRTGCACEGYQYYDCVHAGFRRGKVPEGKSYFVDFGSTECSCPAGGGRISCRFIPCPEVPPNCISVLQPADGCPQCQRLGCVQGSRKYEAGHSFRMHPCQVCHCPKDGGSLMCSPIPDCDPRDAAATSAASTTENQNPHPPDPVEPFSGPRRVQTGNSLPLYKEGYSPPGPDRGEDYDYALPEATPTSATADAPEPLRPQEPATVLPSSAPPHSPAEDVRQELREGRLGVHDADGGPQPGTEGRTHMGHSASSRPTAPPSGAQTLEEGDRRRHGDRDRVTKDTLKEAKYAELPAQEEQEEEEGRHVSHHRHGGEKQEEQQEEVPAAPTVRFRPTSRAPVEVGVAGGTAGGRQPQTLLNYQAPHSEGDGEVSAKDLVDVCCESGERWASTHGHCTNMAPLPRTDRLSICRTAQRQCCLGTLKESRCFAGMAAAREGGACEEDATDRCGVDSYQECCSCCSLGLRFRSEGQACVAHQYLGYPCSHFFTTCCQGTGEEEEEEERKEERKEAQEEEAGGGAWPAVREKPSEDPTDLPKRVSDGPFPNQAFSLGDGENAAEGPPSVEDVDECQYQVCQHGCINTPGSYLCTCPPGLTLRPDGSTCSAEGQDEENRLREDDGPEEESTPSPPPATTQTPAQMDPCEGNGPCMQQCTPVSGRPQCSCFPGFFLLADGLSCEDVNECLSLHACQPDERCLNTAGSFQCQRHISCPLGYHINNDMCEDIDECAQSHACGPNFDCVNTEGSFRCSPRPRCPTGFSQDTHRSCMDIDECSTLGQPCAPGYSCLNTLGSYSCQRKIILCSRGYHASPDRSRCIDVDECQSSVQQCGEGQLCHNLPGSYRCDCQAGFQYDMFRRRCVDVNECWRYPGRLCAQTCENTAGSYQCSCTTGFHLASDNKNCEDVNECLSSPCSQECANIYGSYQCYCRQGYYLREDGHSCDDIDECSQSIGHLCSYKCVNVAGSYQCACPEHGYTMSPNGLSCLDINECSTGAHNCSLAETCYNIHGGFRCLAFDCPPNYRKVSETRCERMSCPNYLDCQNTPLRVTYYHLSFQTNIIIPAQIFRIGPSPAYTGDNVIISITQGNEENYFSTRKLNAYTGAVYLHRQVREPQDFRITVEMKLWRQGTFTTFQAKIYVFITADL